MYLIDDNNKTEKHIIFKLSNNFHQILKLYFNIFSVLAIVILNVQGTITIVIFL